MPKKKKSLRVLQDLVLIKIDDEYKSDSNLIYLPRNNSTTLQGTIVSIGPGTINKRYVFIPTSLKVGDRVLIECFSGAHIKIHNEKHIIVREQEILAILLDKPEDPS